MPKRKLSELTQQPREAPQATRLAETFDQGVQTLSRALRTARGFERQKLGRREQKAKSEKNHDLLDRIGEEIRALKALEYHATAEKYLFKQLVKTKRIAESPAFLEFKQKRNVSTAGPANAAEANVTARMFKTKPMQNAMAGLMGGIRGLLGLEDGLGKPGPGSGGRVAGEAGGGVGKKDERMARPDQGNERTARSQLEGSNEGEEEDEWEGIATDDDDDGVDYSHFDARLAPGSESDSGSGSEPPAEALGDSESDSGSEADETNIPPPQHTTTDTDPTSHTPSPPPKKPKTKTKATQPAAPPTSTTFLPSLSMGGYVSGSESESDAQDPDDGAGAPRRKNRMGQQARRALWEKKFGQSANHVKKQKKDEKTSRDSGWDLRRGATDPQGDRRNKRGKGGFGGGDGRMDKMQQRHSAAAPKKKPQEDNKPLHPSWEAKRKSKEQQQPSTAAFQGKRVVFD